MSEQREPVGDGPQLTISVYRLRDDGTRIPVVTRYVARPANGAPVPMSAAYPPCRCARCEPPGAGGRP